MKRSWLGAGLLVFLLIAGILSSQWMRNTHISIAGDMEQAAGFALREDWDRASGLTRQAREDWERYWKLSAAITDHRPMELIDTLFSQLDIYAAAGETVAYAAGCAQLGTEIKALADTHSFNWWNLL